MTAYEPLVHIITNSVTINDTVNFILASGAAAICADSPCEAAEISSISDALLINIGMPSESKLKAMLAAGKSANKMGIPVVLDPAGAGASGFRKDILSRLLREIKFTCIRGNKSEIASLCEMDFVSKGVEGVEVELCDSAIHEFAAKTGSIVVLTGDIDIIADDKDKFEVAGGDRLIRKVTGSGCMYSAFIAARLAMEKSGSAIKTVRKAASDYKRNAIRAKHLMEERGLAGTASFRQCLIDAMSMEMPGEYFE